MYFSAHMAPVFEQQLGQMQFLPLRKHSHVHSLLQLLIYSSDLEEIKIKYLFNNSVALLRAVTIG